MLKIMRNTPLPKHTSTAVVDALKLGEYTFGEDGEGNGGSIGGESVLLTEITGAGAKEMGGTKSGIEGDSEGGKIGGGEIIGKGGEFCGGRYGGGEGDTVTLEVVHTCIHGNMTSLILTSCTPHEQR